VILPPVGWCAQVGNIQLGIPVRMLRKNPDANNDYGAPAAPFPATAPKAVHALLLCTAAAPPGRLTRAYGCAAGQVFVNDGLYDVVRPEATLALPWLPCVDA
jgi:hypothetical protein